MKALRPFVSVVLSILFGSGVVWNWMNLKIEKERNLFQKQQVEIEKERNSISKLSQIASLNEKLTERFFRYSELNENYIVMLREYENYDKTNQVKKADI